MSMICALYPPHGFGRLSYLAGRNAAAYSILFQSYAVQSVSHPNFASIQAGTEETCKLSQTTKLVGQLSASMAYPLKDAYP
jgi:fructose-1,6-bisphosphatase